MEKNDQKSAYNTFQYTKRRYDDCSAIRLVELIESRQAKAAGQSISTSSNMAIPSAFNNGKAFQPTVSNKVGTTYSKPMETLIKGPLQVCIGLVGMLTTGLAIVTFKQSGQTELLQQSKWVFQESYKALKKGMCDTITSPFHFVVSVIQSAQSKHKL